MICDYVQKPEKYLSKIFKEQTGIYISEYLEMCRLREAEKLLIGSVKTMDEIAGRCGYNSAHSFRRAFKRIYDLSPSQYRQLMSKNMSQVNVSIE